MNFKDLTKLLFDDYELIYLKFLRKYDKLVQRFYRINKNKTILFPTTLTVKHNDATYYGVVLIKDKSIELATFNRIEGTLVKRCKIESTSHSYALYFNKHYIDRFSERCNFNRNEFMMHFIL